MGGGIARPVGWGGCIVKISTGREVAYTAGRREVRIIIVIYEFSRPVFVTSDDMPERLLLFYFLHPLTVHDSIRWKRVESTAVLQNLVVNHTHVIRDDDNMNVTYILCVFDSQKTTKNRELRFEFCHSWCYCKNTFLTRSFLSSL